MPALAPEALEELVAEGRFHQVAARQGLMEPSEWTEHRQYFQARIMEALTIADHIITERISHLYRSQWSQRCPQKKQRASKNRPVTFIIHIRSLKEMRTNTDCQARQITRVPRSSKSTFCPVGGTCNLVAAGMVCPSRKGISRQH